MIACGCDVSLPERYRERVARRDDVRALAERVEWSADDETTLARCDAAVVALPPPSSAVRSSDASRATTSAVSLLEKPLDVSPAAADALLDRLEASGRGFGVGYHFRHTGWGKRLLRDKQGVRRIDWRFRAHHYAHDVSTWKRRPAEGGGALRFYGVHLVALMAEIGYAAAIESAILSERDGEAEAWRATLAGEGLPPCRFEVDSDADAKAFVVCDGKGETTRLADPFDEEAGAPTGMDRRIPVLVEALRETIAAPRREDGLYRKVNRLWAAIEAAGG